KIIGHRVKSLIFLDSDHRFTLIPKDKLKASTFATKEFKKFPELTITQGGFLQKGFLGSKLIPTPLVLNLIHGGDGEDGTIAALLEFYNIPYIGPGREASAISINKLLTKAYAELCGVKTLPYYHMTKRTRNNPIPFDFPIIIKPLRLGSSIGVSVVREVRDLEYALDVAFEFDDELLIEPFQSGIREFNLAGCQDASGNFIFSIIEEPQKQEYLDFDKKYLDFSRPEVRHEANLDEGLKSELRKAFKKLYDPLFAGSLIRCDFFVQDRNVYLNEINPIPGSMANYLFDDFTRTLEALSHAIPTKRPITVKYTYLDQIKAAKGK
ncbi:MAG: D-alanine--D-alanine ligase, partial [Campylobacterales bacterium]